MNKTKMTHDELLATVMAEYTAKVIREEQIRQEIRQGIRPVPAPITNWNISDRH